MVVSGFPPKKYYTRTCTGEQRHRWADRKSETGGGGEGKNIGEQTERKKETLGGRGDKRLQNNIGVSRA